MSDEEKAKRNKVLLWLALVATVAVLGFMIWSVFFKGDKDVTEVAGDGHGAGEEMTYDILSYTNAAILEDELDTKVANIVIMQIELALINNSDLNTKQRKTYNVTFSEPSPALIDSETNDFFYDFSFTISGTDEGEVKYDAHVIVEGNTNPEIKAGKFVTTALKIQSGSYGSFVVSNNPNKERVKVLAEEYAGGDAEIIESGVY